VTAAAHLPVRARFRVEPEDFQVEEVLGYPLDGQGEHLHLWIEKRGANTSWVAGELARWAGVRPMAVGYAGMKDRHAVTRQWFAVHLPKRIAPAQPPLIEGVRVLEQRWHGRKLRRGAHRGNRFAIVLRDVVGDLDAAEAALQRIAADGVPNAFGGQRFGFEAGNIAAARDWLAAPTPARLPAPRRGLLLSAARSHLFNQVLALRIGRGDWNRPLAGDCFQLDGRGSWFGPELAPGDELAERCARGEIHPTGPLWGAGEPPTAADTGALEREVAAAEPVLCAGLAAFGLRQERRALRLPVRGLAWTWDTPDAAGAPASLRLAFELRSGSFATAVLDDFCELHDASQRGGESAAPDDGGDPPADTDPPTTRD
jgi:tRNA pseudouridine13 synthase